MKKYIYEQKILDNIIKYKILVGQNANENWQILDNSAKEDLWFHLADYPSCYTIIQKNVLEHDDIEENIRYYPEIVVVGATHCKNHSKYKDNKNIRIVYTKVKNLKKGKELGSVYIKNEEYIKI